MSRLNLNNQEVRAGSLPLENEENFTSRPSQYVAQQQARVQMNRVGSIRNQIQPTNLKQDDWPTAARSRKLLAENIEKGEGDLNMIWDVCIC